MGTGAVTELSTETLAMTTTDGTTTFVSTKVAGTEQNAVALGTGARANGNGTIVIGAVRHGRSQHRQCDDRLRRYQHQVFRGASHQLWW